MPIFDTLNEVGVAEFADVIKDAALDMLLSEEAGPFTVFAPQRESLYDVTPAERDFVVASAPLHVTRDRHFWRDLRNDVTLTSLQEINGNAEKLQFNRYTNGVSLSIGHSN